MPVDITEYSFMARDAQGNSIPAGREPGLTQQVAIGGASAQSAAFGDGTTFIRVHTDSAVRVAFGANPTASGSSPRMPAGATEFFGVIPGHKLAIIATT